MISEPVDPVVMREAAAAPIDLASGRVVLNAPKDTTPSPFVEAATTRHRTFLEVLAVVREQRAALRREPGWWWL